MVPFDVQVPQPWAQYQYDPAFLEYLENALQWVEHVLKIIPINIWEPLPDTSVNMQELPSLRHSLTHEEKKNNEECAICRMEFEEYEPILRLCPNNHLFHEACITHWINRTGDSRCPYCRQPILIASENLPVFMPNQTFVDYSDYEEKLQESLQQELEIERAIHRTREENYSLERSRRIYLLEEQLSIQRANTENLKNILRSRRYSN